ncbi:hypothetical protein FPANT_776 [Fusarium pseudoanthophilum]|uniref:Hydroxyproline-rich glyco protein n=1 Tax=Fusarium pseudoanthophilum TaxID=48495 RepID=A0A8H5V3R0_9HYPO|nr:hypothetical protein FPANT_776 [Fusarium pseudoanthophilum]
MGESGTTTSAEADGSEASKKDLPPLVEIDPAGDIVLDVTFETSVSTLNKTRKAELAASRKAGTQPPDRSSLKSKVRVAYRVNLGALKKHSKYFSNLLSNSQFREAKLISDIHERLAQLKINVNEADVKDLPWIPITDDDDATKAAGRENAMEDILNIIHQRPTKTSRGTMSYVTTLAIVADRFDCVAAVARVLNTDLKFKWPLTSNKPLRSDDGRPTETEQVLRQKVLVAWLLGQPMRLQQSTRELIMRGSSLWSEFYDADADMTAAWWNMPDGLEGKEKDEARGADTMLILVQRSYDTGLGQMLKFLVNKNLLFLVDYSPASLNMVPDTAMIEIEELLSTLQQCPSYQIDKHHTNCGLRVRLEPILSYMRSMLSAGVIAIPYADWKKRPTEISWLALREHTVGDKGYQPKKFQFTRAIANDQRLRYEGALYVDKMAKAMFMADEWDWTPEN